MIRDKLGTDPSLQVHTCISLDNLMGYVDFLCGNNHHQEQQMILPKCIKKTRIEQRFRSSAYWKTTFTRQYLNFNSHNPYNLEKRNIHCLQHSTKAISCDSNTYEEEINGLRDNFYRNNYPESITSAPKILYKYRNEYNMEPIIKKARLKTFLKLQYELI